MEVLAGPRKGDNSSKYLRSSCCLLFWHLTVWWFFWRSSFQRECSSFYTFNPTTRISMVIHKIVPRSGGSWVGIHSYLSHCDWFITSHDCLIGCAGCSCVAYAVIGWGRAVMHDQHMITSWSHRGSWTFCNHLVLASNAIAHRTQHQLLLFS